MLSNIIIFICLSLSNHLSLGTDTIYGNQSLSGDQCIVSSGGNFELGFFKPGNSSNFYIGIWYKNSVQTIVWVANRETPISNKYSSKLKISYGNLVLLNESQITIWSTNMNSATTSNSVIAVLHDDGNFVLKDGSSATQPVWRSFDYPTDTFLPGSKIGFNKRTNTSQFLTSWKNSEDPAPGLFSFELDLNGSQFLIRWNRSNSYWTSGSWDGHIFSLVPGMRVGGIYNYSYVSNENESYFTYTLLNPSFIARVTMDVSGQIKQLNSLDLDCREWNLLWSQPRQQCEVYAYCGAFGSCNQNVQPPCDCLPGFVPKYSNDRDLGDFSGGCVRKTSLQCGENNVKKDRFLSKSYMGLPQADENRSVQSAMQCESICLDRCNCTAYAYGISECSIWFGELLNMKQLANDDSTGGNVYIRLAASEFSDFSSPKNNKNNKAVVFGSVIGSIAALVAVMGLVIFWRWKNKQGGKADQFSLYVLKTKCLGLVW